MQKCKNPDVNFVPQDMYNGGLKKLILVIFRSEPDVEHNESYLVCYHVCFVLFCFDCFIT